MTRIHSSRPWTGGREVTDLGDCTGAPPVKTPLRLAKRQKPHHIELNGLMLFESGMSTWPRRHRTILMRDTAETFRTNLERLELE